MAVACLSKKCSLVSVLALLVAVVALWFVWFGTSSLISKDVVEANLRNFSEQLVEFGNAHDKDIKLTYGEVKIEGWGYNKKAAVNSVSIEASSKVNPDSKMLVSTDKFTVESDPLNPSRVFFVFAEQVSLSENNQAQKIVSFSEPLKYAYTKVQSSAQSDVFFPSQIVISGADANAVNEKVTIGFASQPTLKFVSSPEQKGRSLAYNFSGVTINGADGSKASIASVVSEFNEAQEGETKITGKFNFAASDIIVGDAVKNSKPYNVSADLSFSSDDEDSSKPITPPSSQGASDVAPAVSKIAKSETVVNKVVFAGNDFKLSASGNIVRSAEDPLPSGELNVDIDNLPQFLASEVVPVEIRGSVEAALEKITGQPILGKTLVSIPVRREKNGVFYIGNTTFEALFASMMSDIMMQRPSSNPVVPSTPVAPETGSVATPDNNVVNGREPEVSIPASAPAPETTVAVPAPVAAPTPEAK